jgi:hypothetical protein
MAGKTIYLSDETHAKVRQKIGPKMRFSDFADQAILEKLERLELERV